ncbi:hypothetical protein Lfu02_03440 [Longispora fulva]|uniref:Uncharacterized protein n=1 Tax=Longispora fulva TaxID=619741 RepID=A0A8J7GFT1_9ACTN|nr:hypothetical protein [Longispora fulva]MBG6135787.1 hypothetical protein [Longispora fulva]GIG55972.1 hypothetical protein Lfu02_03440 [Longispora fulva]
MNQDTELTAAELQSLLESRVTSAGGDTGLTTFIAATADTAE